MWNVIKVTAHAPSGTSSAQLFEEVYATTDSPFAANKIAFLLNHDNTQPTITYTAKHKTESES